jgi:hypothetical protein
MRRPAQLCVAAACVCLAALPAPRHAPRLALTAHGAIAIRDSRAGAAVLVARALKPGAEAAGSVTVAGSGRLYLVSSMPADVRAPLGRRLSLTVSDGARTLLAGTPASLAGCHDLGPLDGARTFRFTVSFPRGRDDNAFAGAATSVDETWLSSASCGPRIDVRGVPRRCTRRDLYVSVRVRDSQPLTRVRVRLDRWTLAVTHRRRLRLRISDDWLVRRRNPLVVTAADRGGGHASKRLEVRPCAAAGRVRSKP